MRKLLNQRGQKMTSQRLVQRSRYNREKVPRETAA